MGHWRATSGPARFCLQSVDCGAGGTGVAVVGMVGMVAIAVGIEVLQIWVPGRACGWVDLRHDGVGMAVGRGCASEGEIVQQRVN